MIDTHTPPRPSLSLSALSTADLTLASHQGIHIAFLYAWHWDWDKHSDDTIAVRQLTVDTRNLSTSMICAFQDRITPPPLPSIFFRKNVDD